MWRTTFATGTERIRVSTSRAAETCEGSELLLHELLEHQKPEMPDLTTFEFELPLQELPKHLNKWYSNYQSSIKSKNTHDVKLTAHDKLHQDWESIPIEQYSEQCLPSSAKSIHEFNISDFLFQRRCTGRDRWSLSRSRRRAPGSNPGYNHECFWLSKGVSIMGLLKGWVLELRFPPLQKINNLFGWSQI